MEPRFAQPSDSASGGNWIPLAVAALLIGSIVAAALVMSSRKPTTEVTAITTGADPYAPFLPMTEIQMSESTSLAGGKVTYIDGNIENVGSRIVRGVTVQVLFHNYSHEVAQNQVLPLTLIRMREPYIDTEPVSAEPLTPGARHDFRLIFDSISPDWAGETPEIRIVRVD